MRNKAKLVPNEAFLPVPEGTRIRYKHLYIRRVMTPVVYGKHTEPKVSPPVLVGTVAWLVTSNGDELPDTVAYALVHPNDTAVKKLGRLKAHNRCIKAYLKQNASS